MKKIVAIIGSPRGYNSQTYKIAYRIFQELKKKNADVSCDFYILSELNINKCTGCTRCFFYASSCASFRDSIDMLEKSMLEADLIIFGSPVYAHNITGEMKNFFDRISHMLHLMMLCGKYAITISTSSSNGNKSVNEYFYKLMLYFGIKLIDQISYMQLLEFDEEKFLKCINTTDSILKDEISFKPNELQEKIFSIYKKAYSDIYYRDIKDKNSTKNQEAIYWYDNGYFNFNSFEELFNAMKNR